MKIQLQQQQPLERLLLQIRLLLHHVPRLEDLLQLQDTLQLLVLLKIREVHTFCRQVSQQMPRLLIVVDVDQRHRKIVFRLHF